MQYKPTRIDRCYRWLETKDKHGKKENFQSFVTWSGTWIGILGSLAIPYFARHNLALGEHTDLKAAAIGILPYTVGMLVSYLGAKAVCILGEKQEAQNVPVKAEELSDRL